ncbi:hypothetical protein GTP91_14015 [Rugamonas sp. FT82W]|uniref:Uncharacterized protein n=1 Tax=Duganella vulcania TaxID=2692166 RepID=A0A845G376_9BURK|nr:hypothetical protein [Duganella vulcania]MYM88291.1 hypothetical protein [Duganella vulcania]
MKQFAAAATVLSGPAAALKSSSFSKVACSRCAMSAACAAASHARASIFDVEQARTGGGGVDGLGGGHCDDGRALVVAGHALTGHAGALQLLGHLGLLLNGQGVEHDFDDVVGVVELG